MKYMHRCIGQFFIVMTTLALASGCAQTTVREHPDFASKQHHAKNIIVLPIDAEIHYLVMTGDNERMPDNEAKVVTELSTSLPGMLERRGYMARYLSLDELNKQIKDAGFTLEKIKSAYTALSKQLYESNLMSEDDAKKIRVAIGPIASDLASKTNADAFLIARYGGFKKSPGMISKDLAATVLLGVLTGTVIVQAPDGGSLELALVESHSGDVLWTNRGGSGGIVANRIAVNLLNKLPSTGAAAEREKTKELAKKDKEVAQTD